MVAANSTGNSSGSGNIDLTNILSAVQNWVVAENALNKQLALVISSNHLNLSITGLSTTVGTVTTINTSIGLTGGPINTTGTLAVLLPALSNSISSDFALSSIAYVDGPVVTQGISGRWFASGTVTVQDSAGSASYSVKLWDGTTTMASDRFVTTGANLPMASGLAGFITSPASNIKISVSANSSASVLKATDATGNVNNSNITAIRIG